MDKNKNSFSGKKNKKIFLFEKETLENRFKKNKNKTIFFDGMVENNGLTNYNITIGEKIIQKKIKSNEEKWNILK